MEAKTASAEVDTASKVTVKVSGETSNGLEIPETLNDINSEWILNLVRRTSKEESLTLTHLNITTELNDGFYDSCCVSVRSSNGASYKWVVVIVPNDTDLKDIISRHGLFQKEILFYEEVLPFLTAFVKERNSHFDLKLSVMNYVYGDYDTDDDCGVMVFDDPRQHGFVVHDPVFLVFDAEHVREVVRSLAAFHGVCIGYQLATQVSLDEKFPLLQGDKACTWFQEDMSSFLYEMYRTCREFLQSVPGQEDLCQWFERKMSCPEKLYQEEKNHPTLLKSILHGDLWHNNILLNNKDNVIFSHWEMCHFGHATADLCFFLFSSTTSAFRRDHWDDTVRLYYDTLVKTVQVDLRVDNFPVSYEDLLRDVKYSIPVSLFFCGNIHDLDLTSQLHGEHLGQTESIIRQPSCEEDPITETGGVEDTFRRLQSCMNFIDVPGRSDRRKSESPRPSLTFEDSVHFTLGPRRPSPAPTGQTQAAPSALPVLIEKRPLAKVPTIATESDLMELEDRRRKQKLSMKLSPRKARAMRRKLYLDLYRDAVNRSLI